MKTTVPAILALALAGALARGSQDPPRTLSPEERSSAALHYFTDTQLVTQDNKKVRLYSDLLKGKTVVINSFFATCQGSCPRMAAKLSALQSEFPGRLGNDLLLISISVDPEMDTPERLKAYAELHHAKPGWLFLTGKKENVEFALYKLGQKVDRREDHLSLFIIGNERTGLWKKAAAQVIQPDQFREMVAGVLNDPGK